MGEATRDEKWSWTMSKCILETNWIHGMLINAENWMVIIAIRSHQCNIVKWYWTLYTIALCSHIVLCHWAKQNTKKNYLLNGHTWKFIFCCKIRTFFGGICQEFGQFSLYKLMFHFIRPNCEKKFRLKREWSEKLIYTECLSRISDFGWKLVSGSSNNCSRGYGQISYLFVTSDFQSI